jgi:type II secretory pathway component PulM
MLDRERASQAVGIALLVVALVALGFSWRASIRLSQQSDELKHYVQCQAEWTAFLHSAVAASRDASAEAQVALDDLINAITTAKSREESAAALARYIQAREEQKKVQAQNPLPPPPKEVCHIG